MSRAERRLELIAQHNAQLEYFLGHLKEDIGDKKPQRNMLRNVANLLGHSGRIGYTEIDLDTRFEVIRGGESAIGNFFGDIVRFYTGADAVILNSGFLRSDCILDKGLISVGILEKMIPIMDIILVIEISGAELITALESGVSKYPGYDGRFPVVSGLEFTFVGNEEPMKRVLPESVSVGGKKIEMEKLYSLAAKSFIANGKDGYDCLSKCKRIVDMNCASIFTHMVIDFWRKLRKISLMLTLTLLANSFLDSVQNPLFYDESEAHANHKMKHVYEKYKQLIHRIVEEEGTPYVCIYPKLDGRIKIITK